MSKSIAHPSPTAVIDTLAKFHRLMAKEGVPFEAFTPPMQSVVKRRNLAKFLNFGCPDVKSDDIVDAKLSDHDLARIILRDDFIAPEEVATARDLVYTDRQIKNLEADLPPLKDIVWLRDNGYMLVPAPPKAISFLEIYDLNRELVDMETRTCEPFARDDLTEVATWLGIRKEYVPNSIGMNWKEQSSLLSGVERVPNAPELLWALTTYREVRDANLMSCYNYARTSSVASDNKHIWIGKFTSYGLEFGWDDSSHVHIGVASARKFN